MAWAAKPTGKRGRQPVYTDAAVQTCLTMKVLFGMALRQTTGFDESLLQLAGLDWQVPDFSILSRRQKILTVNIPHRGSQGPLHRLINSTGIKVEGEGKWNARTHGSAERRVWRKVHLGIDGQTPQIMAVAFTSSDAGDAPMLPELLNQIPPDEGIASVTAPLTVCRKTTRGAERGAAAMIQPRKNANPWKTVTAGAVERFLALRAPNYVGRARWRRSTVWVPSPRPHARVSSPALSFRLSLSAPPVSQWAGPFLIPLNAAAPKLVRFSPLAPWV